MLLKISLVIHSLFNNTFTEPLFYIILRKQTFSSLKPQYILQIANTLNYAKVRGQMQSLLEPACMSLHSNVLLLYDESKYMFYFFVTT